MLDIASVYLQYKRHICESLKHQQQVYTKLPLLLEKDIATSVDISLRKILPEPEPYIQ